MTLPAAAGPGAEHNACADGDDYVRLVRAAQRGDRDAYGQLYLRFGRAVHAVLMARLPPAQVDDLVQDVFLHALTRLRDLREPAAFGGWICTLARRRAADYYRRLARVDPLVEAFATAASPELAAEAAAAVDAIQKLPESYRETLALRLLGGCSGPEIAAITGLTADSVRVNLHRGFKLLRERLGETP